MPTAVKVLTSRIFMVALQVDLCQLKYFITLAMMHKDLLAIYHPIHQFMLYLEAHHPSKIGLQIFKLFNPNTPPHQNAIVKFILASKKQQNLFIKQF